MSVCVSLCLVACLCVGEVTVLEVGSKTRADLARTAFSAYGDRRVPVRAANFLGADWGLGICDLGTGQARCVPPRPA